MKSDPYFSTACMALASLMLLSGCIRIKDNQMRIISVGKQISILHQQGSVPASKSADNRLGRKVFAYNGYNGLGFQVPALIRFEKSSDPSIEVSAPAKLLNALSFEDGHFNLAGVHIVTNLKQPITITIHASQIPKINVGSIGQVTFLDINQSQIYLETGVASYARITGRVEKLQINASDASRVDVTELDAASVEVYASAASRVRLKGSDDVLLRADNVAEIILNQKPKNLRATTNALGKIIRKY